MERTRDRRVPDSRRCRRRGRPVDPVAGDAMSVRTQVAVWFCPDCTRNQRQGSWPCTACCGYTGKRDKVAVGVTDAVGRPSKRTPS